MEGGTMKYLIKNTSSLPSAADREGDGRGCEAGVGPAVIAGHGAGRFAAMAIGRSAAARRQGATSVLGPFGSCRHIRRDDGHLPLRCRQLPRLQGLRSGLRRA